MNHTQVEISSHELNGKEPRRSSQASEGDKRARRDEGKHRTRNEFMMYRRR